jgi:prepilin peptidase CpaA
LRTLISLLGIGIFFVVAYCDLRTRRIPNSLAIAIGALGLVRMIVIGDPSAAFYTLAVAAAVLAITFPLFWRGLVGGGDVKLLTGAALLVGHEDFLGFLLTMSLCGGILALAVVAAHKLGPRLLPAAQAATTPQACEDRGRPARLTVPYGVAIAAAGVLVLLQSSVPG